MRVRIEDFEDYKGRVSRHAEPPFQSRISPEREKPRDYVVGGPHTASYEKLVQKLFNPANALRKNPTDPTVRYGVDVPKEKLDNEPFYSPMEFYTKYGVDDRPEPQFNVYKTKSSSEYFATMNKKPMLYDSPALSYKAAKTASSPNCWDYVPSYDCDRYHMALDKKRTVVPERTKQMLIDYKEFPSSPLSPYLYLRHEYVHGEDSRIIGSNFVQLSLRPNDNFLNRVDKVLAEAKKYNRWSM